MPVNIKSSNMDFLKKVGVPTHLIEQLKFDGVVVKLGTNTVKFTVKADDLLVGVVALPVAVSTAVKGVAGGFDVAALLTKYIEEVLGPRINALKHGLKTDYDIAGEVAEELKPNVSFKPAASSYEGTTNLGALLKAKLSTAEEMPDTSFYPGQAGLSSTMLKSADPVTLRDATHLYQRVMGSTSTQYYVVAMNKDVKIAVKIDGNALSMRAEGNLTPTVQQALSRASLSLKSKNGQFYMSQHFTCDEDATVSHLLGALLSATELEFDTAFPSIKKLQKMAL